MGRLRKLVEDRKITIELSPEARSFLAEKGYDPAYAVFARLTPPDRGPAGPPRR